MSNDQDKKSYFKQPPSINDKVPEASYSIERNIDISELITYIWSNKLIIIIFAILFSITSMAYVFKAQEWWTAKAQIIKPQLSDYAKLDHQIKMYKPAYEILTDNASLTTSEDLTNVVDTEELIKAFIYKFNSQQNKKLFLEQSEEFKNQLKSTKTEGNLARSKELSTWYSKIKATPLKLRDNEIYNVNFQSTTRENSYSLLNEYIAFTSNNVNHEIISNLKTTLSSQRSTLKQKIRTLEDQAKNKLDMDIVRSKYALKIAKEAEISSPIQGLINEDIFPIHLGTKALTARIKALQEIKNYSLVIPEIQQLEAQLKVLNETKLASDINFSSFHFISEPEMATERDKPHRTLLVIISTLLGLLIGLTITLIKFTISKISKR